MFCITYYHRQLLVALLFSHKRRCQIFFTSRIFAVCKAYLIDNAVQFRYSKITKQQTKGNRKYLLSYNKFLKYWRIKKMNFKNNSEKYWIILIIALLLIFLFDGMFSAIGYFLFSYSFYIASVDMKNKKKNESELVEDNQ